MLYLVTGWEFLGLVRKIPQEQNLERSRLSLKIIKVKLVCVKNGPSESFLNIFSLLIRIEEREWIMPISCLGGRKEFRGREGTDFHVAIQKQMGMGWEQENKPQ